MRSSIALARCAVVRPDSPPPMARRPRPITFFPASASRYAVDSPAIPAPTTHTSARISAKRGERGDIERAIPDRSGVTAGEVVVFRHDTNSEGVNPREDRIALQCRRCTSGAPLAVIGARGRHFPSSGATSNLRR